MPSLDGTVIAFDLDGTLVDTAPDLIGALNSVLAEEGLASLPVASARQLIGRGARALIEKGFAEAGEVLDPDRTPQLLERFIAHYRSRIAQESAPFEGLDAALDALAAEGARLAVCTNKRTDLSLQLLDALGLTGRFAAIVGSDLVAQKPDPRLLYLAIEKAGGAMDRALFVGDSVVDLQTARRASAPIVGVSFGYSDEPLVPTEFDAFIDHFSQLPNAALKLLA